MKNTVENNTLYYGDEQKYEIKETWMTEDFEKDTQKNKGIIQLINGSVEIASSAVAGVAAGLLSGDPILVSVIGVGSKALELTFRWVGNEISERMIGPREKVRAGAVTAFAMADIHKRLKSGENLRDDGFFDNMNAGRSDAGEILESVVLKAQRETEEKKIQYMGYLYSNIAFNSQIDVHTAHKFINIAEELTYRQLCIIKLSLNTDRIDFNNFGNSNITPKLSSILTDFFEVREKELIDPNNLLIKKIHELYLGVSGKVWIVGAKPSEYPKYTDVFRENFIKFTKLDQIPDEHIDSILRELKLGLEMPIYVSTSTKIR